MPNELQKKGAQPSRPPHYGVLWHNNFYQGIVTQRNPLRANLQHIEEEFYGSQVSMIDGLNTEISTNLTLIRRPGHTVYNSSTITGPINRFYENRVSVFNGSQTATTETIQVLADNPTDVLNVTGPSTNSVVFAKSAGAGSTYFQSVGNELFFSDGPDQKKLITPNLIWAANQKFNTGNQILDPNGNLQIVQGTGTATITNIAVVSSTLGVVGGPTVYFLKITFSSDVFWTQGTPVSFTGVTTYTVLNKQTQTVVVNPTYLTPSPTVAYFTTSAQATYGPAADTGTATSTNSTGFGLSGGSAPTWNLSLGGFTTDNQLTWQNFGPPLYNWAVPAPTLAPLISIPAGNRYWIPNFTIPSPGYYAVLDTNGNIEVTPPGVFGVTTGSTVPTWNPVYNSTGATGGIVTGTTSDGSVQWLNAGPLGSWQASTEYFTFRCILDSNKNIQFCGGQGTSGGTQPTWATGLGATTSDGSITWYNYGPGTVLVTGPLYYAYSWVSTDGSVSTASPVAPLNTSGPVIGPSGNPIATISGSFLSDPQITAAWLWRSTQGGSSGSLFFDSSIPNPTPGTASNWAFDDILPDTFLNELIEAPQADQNDPPPVGITALAFHLNRVWGAVGNIVYNSQTLGIVGNPYTAWDPQDFFEFPSKVVRLYPTPNGLIVFTVSEPYIIQGLGDASSSFFSTPFLQNVGLANYDAFAVNGAVAYLYTTDNQVLSLDPNSGFSEVGSNIGDQFGPNNGNQTFTPSTAFLTWHYDSSQEKALYVSNRTGNWWRLLPTPSPETGYTWCPMATIVGEFSAVQSVETSPGVNNLLLGPISSGPILKRDSTVYSDNGSAYNAYGVFGSIVLAQPGQLAYAKLVTTDSINIGTPLTLEVQLDEISYVTGLATAVVDHPGTGYTVGELLKVSGGNPDGTIIVTSISGPGPTGPATGVEVLIPGQSYPSSATNVATLGFGGSGLTVNITNGGFFEELTAYVPDPTQLSPSKTINAQRFYMSQTQQPAVCRHMQVLVNFAEDLVKNELLSMTIFGSFEQEM